MIKRWLCVLLSLCLLLLAGCARKEATVPLTQEEIDRANEAFVSDGNRVVDGRIIGVASEISCFFTSYYSDPSQIDLWEFLLYCPINTVLEDSDIEEFQAVLAAVEIDGSKFPLPSDYITPVRRYRKADVSALLKKYANITVDDLTGTEDRLYLKEYDAYYNFTSDYGPGRFQCVGGEKAGDMIRFWSEEDTADGSREVLTIREENGEYFIQSFEKVHQ